MKAILQKIGQYGRAALGAALQHSGTAMLYLGASTLLAGILITIIMSYAWDINKERWYRAFAILRGIELAEIQQAERDQIAKISRADVLEARAVRTLQGEYDRAISGRMNPFSLPPATPEPPPPAPPSDASRISAYEQRIQADTARSKAAGVGLMTEILSSGSPSWAKEVIRKHWKDGEYQLVLQVLLDLEEKPRNRILFAMQETNDEELKDLSEILLRIAAGEPRTSILREAAKEP